MNQADGILAGLNPPQREAVLNTEGPLLILSGAGSGKTRVITHRIAYLMNERGVSPFNILAVTFTNKAAGEMKTRLEKLVGLSARIVWVGTFHSICARILRQDIEKLGYTSSFTIYDDSDQVNLMKEIMSDMRMSEKNWNPRAIISSISRAKNDLIDYKEYAITADDYYETTVAELYREYQSRLRRNNALDFGDLIMLCVRLLEENEDIAGRYQDRFRYIMVDEYQDTNHAQYRLVNLLAAGHHNICVVGDDDQGIYSWRGADIKNILDFENDYPDARVIKLEQNYRSTPQILDAAFSVISRNKYRKEKRLWTDNAPGDRLITYEASDEADEGDFIARQIRTQVNNGSRFGDIAVFYRINAQSRSLEDALRRAGIPYTIVGSVRFYDRSEIKDILAYLRVIVNPNDAISLRRIINVPPRRIGKTTLGRLDEYGARKAMTLYESLIAAAEGEIEDVDRAQSAISQFVDLIRSIDSNGRPTEILRSILDKTGYFDYLLQDKTPQAESRVENVKELISATEEYEERNENPTLAGFLEEVSLISDIDELGNDDRVSLMTLHSAKGLEFETVFITGMEEGLLPHQRSIDNEAALEEERRLLYVGITRAMKRVFLTRAVRRRLFGSEMFNTATRFLDEIPRNLIRTIDEMERFEVSIARKFHSSECSYSAGDRIKHPKWGRGIVFKTTGKGSNMRVTVRFETGETKTLVADYANLEKI